MSDVFFMKMALQEARRAFLEDEVPIGCVIVRNGEVIAVAHNQKENSNMATYHAEILAINKACAVLGTWHLEDCIIYTTVEPCMMCMGAIIQSRISKVVYGTVNDSFGYLRKLERKKIVVEANVLSEECSSILSEFFQKQRRLKD